MCTKEEIISCRSARNDKTSTTARSYFQGPKVRPRLPKKPLYPLFLSHAALTSYTRTKQPVHIYMWWGIRIDCSLAAYGYKHILYRNCPIFWTGNKKLIPLYIYTHQLSTAFLTTWIVYYTHHRVHLAENISINDIVENILNT